MGVLAGPDGLRFLKSSTPGDFAELLYAIGVLPGITILAAADKNGAGTGSLKMRAGRHLSWRPPGSASYGAEVDVLAGGQFLVRGVGLADADKFVRVQSYPAFLPADERTADVRLHVRPGRLWQPLPPDLWPVPPYSPSGTQYLQNVSEQEISNLAVWLEPGQAEYLELAVTGAGPWSAPTTEAAAIDLPSINPNAVGSFAWRITVPGGTAKRFAVPAVINLRWDGN